MNYRTKRWQAKRKKILKRDKHLCQISLRYGKRVEADTVHHIYPIKEYPQYAWCDWNLISLSKEAHNRLHNRADDSLTSEGLELLLRTPPPAESNLTGVK